MARDHGTEDRNPGRERSYQDRFREEGQRGAASVPAGLLKLRRDLHEEGAPRLRRGLRSLRGDLKPGGDPD